MTRSSPSAAGSTARVMGALTPATMGDIPITGASIASGNGSGHFQVTGGAIVGSAAGVAAAYNAGPYTLTTDDGQVFVVTTVANAYSVGKASDFNGASGVGKIAAGTLAGKRIIGRPGLTMASGVDGNVGDAMRRANYGTVGTAWAGLTLESEDATSPWAWTDATGPNVTFRYVTFKNMQFVVPTSSSSTGMALQGSVSFVVTDLIFSGCLFVGATKDPNGNYAGVNPTQTGEQAWGNGNAIAGNGTSFNSNIRVIGCTFKYCLRGVNLPANAPADANAGNLVPLSVELVGNYFETTYSIPMQVSYGGANNPVTVSDNVIWGVCAKSTDYGNPHADGILFSASSTATTDWTVTANRNVILQNGRAGCEPIALRDFYQGVTDSGHAFIATIIGNLVVSGSTEGIAIDNARDCVLLNNTILSHEILDPSLKSVINVGAPAGVGVTTYGTHRLERNVAEVIQAAAGSTLVSNIELGLDGATFSYASAFVGSFPSTASRATAIAAYTFLPAGPLDIAGSPDVGAAGSGAVIWAAANPSVTAGSNNVG